MIKMYGFEVIFDGKTSLQNSIKISFASKVVRGGADRQGMVIS
jgi:hypothetical protein